MPKRYPPAFRRKVIDLLTADRSVTGVAADLDVSPQTIYNGRGHEPRVLVPDGDGRTKDGVESKAGERLDDGVAIGPEALEDSVFDIELGSPHSSPSVR